MYLKHTVSIALFFSFFIPTHFACTTSINLRRKEQIWKIEFTLQELVPFCSSFLPHIHSFVSVSVSLCAPPEQQVWSFLGQPWFPSCCPHCEKRRHRPVLSFSLRNTKSVRACSWPLYTVPHPLPHPHPPGSPKVLNQFHSDSSHLSPG